MQAAVCTAADAASFATAIQSNTPTLVDFWAEWCAPCRALLPVINELANDYDGKLNVVKVDVAQHPQIAAQCEVRRIPTLLLFKDGAYVTHLRGMSKSALIEELEEYL